MCKIYAHNSPPSEKASIFLLNLYHILYHNRYRQTPVALRMHCYSSKSITCQ
jgi:hypothetical protein